MHQTKVSSRFHIFGTFRKISSKKINILGAVAAILLMWGGENEIDDVNNTPR